MAALVVLIPVILLSGASGTDEVLNRIGTEVVRDVVNVLIRHARALEAKKGPPTVPNIEAAISFGGFPINMTAAGGHFLGGTSLRIGWEASTTYHVNPHDASVHEVWFDIPFSFDNFTLFYNNVTITGLSGHHDLTLKANNNQFYVRFILEHRGNDQCFIYAALIHQFKFSDFKFGFSMDRKHKAARILFLDAMNGMLHMLSPSKSTYPEKVVIAMLHAYLDGFFQYCTYIPTYPTQEQPDGEPV